MASALTLCALSCDRYNSARDQGKELVNAAGLSVAETLKVLNGGADVNQPSSTHFGWTPLISAIYSRKEDVVDVLLAHGADPDLGDGYNKTALYWAVQDWGQNTNLVAKLIRHGADPTIKTRLGADAFSAADHQPNEDALRAILQEGLKVKSAAP